MPDFSMWLDTRENVFKKFQLKLKRTSNKARRFIVWGFLLQKISLAYKSFEPIPF
jgi:hypothetical protein